VTAINSPGMTAIAAADNGTCTGLQITSNYIANNGFHTGRGWPWANGIDVRCNNAWVANDTVRNATDGGISFYGGENTIIEYNWIANGDRSAYSGIIAASTYAASFNHSVVRNNLVEACCGQHIHIALSVGTYPWCDDSNPTCSQHPEACDCLGGHPKPVINRHLKTGH
jgi:hypothetical protein